MEDARERGEHVWLMHYPETHYSGIEKLAKKFDLRAVKSKGMFAPRITSGNYSSYFTDSADCGMGHVTALGGELWTKHLAHEIASHFKNGDARQ